MAFTYFFRDLYTLEIISDHVLPYLSSERNFKIWDAGCAMGQEPYSLSMILIDKMSNENFQKVEILATDIDESTKSEQQILEGSYPEAQIVRIPKDIFKNNFRDDIKDGYYKLNQEIIDSVTFKKHDLLSLIPPDDNFGLIVCKNVLLHFTASQRIDVIKMYYDSLAVGGYLALEQTQKLPNEVLHLFRPVVSSAQVFKKTQIV
jgi:chemotaxis protein methyltransferase CheR